MANRVQQAQTSFERMVALAASLNDPEGVASLIDLAGALGHRVASEDRTASLFILDMGVRMATQASSRPAVVHLTALSARIEGLTGESWKSLLALARAPETAAEAGAHVGESLLVWLKELSYHSLPPGVARRLGDLVTDLPDSVPEAHRSEILSLGMKLLRSLGDYRGLVKMLTSLPKTASLPSDLRDAWLNLALDAHLDSLGQEEPPPEDIEMLRSLAQWTERTEDRQVLPLLEGSEEGEGREPWSRASLGLLTFLISLVTALGGLVLGLSLGEGDGGAPSGVEAAALILPGAPPGPPREAPPPLKPKLDASVEPKDASTPDQGRERADRPSPRKEDVRRKKPRPRPPRPSPEPKRPTPSPAKKPYKPML